MLSGLVGRAHACGGFKRFAPPLMQTPDVELEASGLLERSTAEMAWRMAAASVVVQLQVVLVVELRLVGVLVVVHWAVLVALVEMVVA